MKQYLIELKDHLSFMGAREKKHLRAFKKELKKEGDTTYQSLVEKYGTPFEAFETFSKAQVFQPVSYVTSLVILFLFLISVLLVIYIMLQFLVNNR